MKRINWFKVHPEAYKAVFALATFDRKGSVEARVRELVKLRVSQINGCAFCVDMHARELREAGETDRRLALLVCWREAPDTFTPRERAALAFAEAMNELGPEGVPDDVYARALEEFGEKPLVEIAITVVAINAWNRLNVAFHMEPGAS